MENAINKSLYRKAKGIADKVYDKHSAYKSMFISKKYMEMGGKFKGKSMGRLSNICINKMFSYINGVDKRRTTAN